MVALEAAAHGIPTVAFNVGGVSDAVKDGGSGNLIAIGRNMEFADAVCHTLLSQSDKKIQGECRHFASKFEWSLFRRQLYLLLNETFKKLGKVT